MRRWAAAILAMAVPAWADPLSVEPGAPAHAATAAEAEAATAARRACQAMVVHLNRGAEIWEQVRRGALAAPALRAQLDSTYDNDWRGATGACNVALAELPASRGQQVLVHEQELALALHAAQRAVLAAWAAEGAEADLAPVIAAWNAALARWSDWYPRAEEFWAAGLFTAEAAPCLGESQGGLRRLSVRIWLLAALADPPSKEAVAALEDDATRVAAALDACRGDSALDVVEARHLRATLALLRDAIAALPRGDVAALRDLQAREQASIARQLRCRKELAAGRPSADCGPG